MTAKKEFISTIELFYSIYRDCRLSFYITQKDFEKQQEIMLVKYKEQGIYQSIDDLDMLSVHYGVMEEEIGMLKFIAQISQGEWKKKLGIDGSNIRYIGNMCLVLIYQYWEDYYRDQIAISKGITKDELQSDLFGDIRQLRRSIVHNNGIAIGDVDQCKILKWFKSKDIIFIDAEKMDFLLEILKKEINGL
ncbi:MAG: hypothetical protein ABSG01_03580 [Anaerolineales bacterium]|jgi:hypothetical protein